MWTRLAELLRCPVSGEPLEPIEFEGSTIELSREHLKAAEQMGLAGRKDVRRCIDAGVLLSESSGFVYPIFEGLPILLPYQTDVHRRFAAEYSSQLRRLRGSHRFAAERPVEGERAVSKSFSKEWATYRYDGVIWDITYPDNESRLLTELGVDGNEWNRARFLEVGCGLGLTTWQAQKHFGGDAIGADLSVAVLRASRHFRANPFLHFVQASAFHLPFGASTFDIVYSRGVLHHTYSTAAAVKSVTAHCRPGGRIYIWVYGPGSINDTLLRRVAYGAELALRPVLSRSPGLVAQIVLAPVAGGYVALNRLRRHKQRDVQPYTFARAMHAARDRCTPRYAHRQDGKALAGWLREAGCDEIEQVDWQRIPVADQDDYRRNTGVRGTKRSPGGSQLPPSSQTGARVPVSV
jgi:SAM-dependent methyltransferase/uncharacterized protein YbaR (Trm112 family)